MKKLLVGAIVGGILIFVWQALSWTMLQLHYGAYQYTPKQDTVMNFINSQFKEDGQYFMPGHPKDASSEEMETAMKNAEGKPWVVLTYHSKMENNMVMNIVRAAITDIIMVWLLCWILLKIPTPGFGTIFMSTLLTGIIAFINGVYTMHVWFGSFDTMQQLIDTLVSWGLCAAWLGWWLRR